MSHRLVSKGEYVKAHTKRAALRTVSTLLIFLTFFCGMVTASGGVIIVITAIAALSGYADMGVVCLVSCCITLFCAALTYGCWRVMEAAALHADSIHPGTPLTRANSADLPTAESLVRASAEPMQAQEAVLLRAATEEPSQHEEQLLRAAEA